MVANLFQSSVPCLFRQDLCVPLLCRSALAHHVLVLVDRDILAQDAKVESADIDAESLLDGSLLSAPQRHELAVSIVRIISSVLALVSAA